MELAAGGNAARGGDYTHRIPKDVWSPVPCNLQEIS